MMKMKIAAVFAAAAIALSGCASGSKTVIETVGDVKITGGDLDFYITQLTGMGESFDQYKDRAMNDIEQSVLVREVGKKWGFTLTDEEKESVDSSLVRIRKQMGGKKEFDEKLKKYGTSEEFLKTLIEGPAYEKKYEAAADKPEITDEQMREYFKNNYYRAKHVLIATKDMTTGQDKDKTAAKTTADEVLKKAQAGENFDALIQTYGEDPGMQTNPDGYIFTTGAMVQQFEDKTDELKPGEIGMCESDYGYHIILRLALDETPELFEKFYADNTADIRNAVEQNNYEASLAVKADEYGIKINRNEEALKNLKQMFPEDNAKSDSSSK